MEYIITENGKEYQIFSEEILSPKQLAAAVVDYLQRPRNVQITDFAFDILADYASAKGISISEAIEEMAKDLSILKEKAEKS